MKGLKKLVLATAVAAAPFAQAEMTAMDDALLGEMTGQAGVTIELSANVSVGSFVFTDTDGYVPNALFTIESAATAYADSISATPAVGGVATAGTFSMNNIVLGGAGGTGALDDIKIDIDIDGNDGLVIHLGGTNTADVITGGAKAVDFGLSVGSVDVNSATLASNIAINGNLGPIDVVIANDSTISVDAYFEVTSGGMDIDVLGMGLTNLTVGDDSAPIASSNTYSGAIDAVQAIAVAQNAALIAGGGDLAVSSNGAAITGAGDQAVADLLAADPTADAAAQTAARTAGETAATDAFRAGGEAAATAQVEAGAITGVSNMAYVGMTISTVDTSYFNLATAADVDINNALNISIDAMNMDITADVSLGQTGGVVRELGSIAINDLDLSGTSLTIYGH